MNGNVSICMFLMVLGEPCERLRADGLESGQGLILSFRLGVELGLGLSLSSRPVTVLWHRLDLRSGFELGLGFKSN